MQLWSYNHTTASSQRTPAGFDVSINGLNRHNSKLTKNFCRIYNQCSYGPTTTQQQAHKELLQDLQQTFYQQINQKL
jgi:hypothetical protein